MKSIEYAQKSWNPYSGCLNWSNGVCAIGKDCWAYSMAYRLRGRYGYDKDNPFKPTFHPDKLDIPLRRKKPTTYATCFMGDIAYCKVNFMWQIKQVMKNCPQHTFLMLTKLPEKLRYDLFPHNVWLGVTVNQQDEVHRIRILKGIHVSHKWVSFEPPYERIDCDLKGIDGIAIGAQTGKHPFRPDPDAVIHLIALARNHNAKIVIKDNLNFSPKFVEWPEVK